MLSCLHFNHTFSSALPKNVPEANLCAKKSRAEKHEDRVQKRKLTQHISDQLKENLPMSVLAEGEWMSSYNHKRLALSFHQPATQAKRKKSHYPNELSLTWDVDGAINELQNLLE